MYNEYSRQEGQEIFNSDLFHFEMKYNFSTNVSTIEEAESLVKKACCLSMLAASTPSKNNYAITDADFEDSNKEKSWDTQWDEELRSYTNKYIKFITRD
jgi:hypothetical protein